MFFFVWGFQIGMFYRSHSKDYAFCIEQFEIIGALINETMLPLFEVHYFDREQMHLHGINAIRYI